MTGRGNVTRYLAGKKVRWRVRYTDPQGRRTATGAPKVLSKSFATESAAKSWLKGLDRAVDDGTYFERQKPVAPDLTEVFRRLVFSREKRASTIAKYETVFRLYVESKLGDRPVDKIGPSDVYELLSDMLKSGRGYATVEATHVCLSSSFEFAKRHRLRTDNPARGMRPAKPEAISTGDDEDDVRVLSVPEVEKLIAATPEHYRPLMRTLAMTGLRIGEACFLRVKDVDLKAGKIRVRGTLNLVRGHFVETPPKTKAGARVVPIAGPLLAALKADRELRPADYHFFTTPGGQPIRRDLFAKRVFAKAAKDAGLWPMHLHHLRHAACSLYLRAGLTGWETAQLLGHGSEAMVRRVYAHLHPEEAQQAAVRLSELWASEATVGA